jgi:hypothetical protein
MLMRALFMSAAILFLGCGTRLSSTDVQAEQASHMLGASGYRDHEDDATGLDKIRYQAIYCNSGGILLRAGHPADGGAGPQCPTVSP